MSGLGWAAAGGGWVSVNLSRVEPCGGVVQVERRYQSDDIYICILIILLYYYYVYYAYSSSMHRVLIGVVLLVCIPDTSQQKVSSIVYLRLVV